TVTPVGLRITAVTDRSLVAEWMPIRYLGDEGGYRLEASTSPGGPPVAIATTASKEITSAVVRGLDPSKRYFVTVTAVTHPHGYQRNLVASEPSDAVEAITGMPTVAPAEIAVTASPEGLVQIDGQPAGTDSFALTNFGDVSTVLTLEGEGGFFTLSPSQFTLAGGATQVVTLSSVSGRPAGSYWGAVFAEGSGVPEDFYVTVTLLSVARPAGTVVAEAVTSRIELSGLPGTDSVGTARFRNVGTARLTGVLVSDVPWIAIPNEPIGIDPGSIGTANFTVVRSRRPPGDGALTGTIRLVYVDGGSEQASTLEKRIHDGSTGVSTTLVTVVDVLRPPTGSSAIPPLGAGEIALFAPGIPSILEGNRLASNVSVANSYGTTPITDLRAYYAPAGSTQVTVATLASIGTSTSVTLANVVPTVFGSTVPQIGSLQFRTRDWRNLVLQGKLLGLGGGSSRLGEIPIFRSDRALGPGEVAYLTGVAKAPPITTDIVVQETTGAPASVTVEFLDAGGSPTGTPRTAEIQAFASVVLEDAVPAGAVTALVTHSGDQGGVVAYGRVIAGPDDDRWTTVDARRVQRFALDEAARVPLVESDTGEPSRRRTVRRPSGGTNATTSSSATTALWLFNPSESEAIVRLALVGVAGTRNEMNVTVSARQTLHLPDVVRSIRGSNGRGSLTIAPLQGQIVAAARTERRAGGALDSVTSLPVVRDTTGLRLGQTQRFAALEDPTAATIAAQTPGTFRTGFGFVETSGQSATIRASVWLHDGRSPISQLLGRDFALGPNEVLLVDRLGHALFGESRDASLPDLHDLQVEFEVISGTGSVMPFVVITDNASGDALLRVE
ncbi:MAG: fibronectin type III domain-containing protein, partial [Thermoanaerobaculia bacterium]